MYKGITDCYTDVSLSFDTCVRYHVVAVEHGTRIVIYPIWPLDADCKRLPFPDIDREIDPFLLRNKILPFLG